MKKKLCIQLAIIVFFICFGTAAWAGGVIASAETKIGTCPSSLEQHISALTQYVYEERGSDYVQ